MTIHALWLLLIIPASAYSGFVFANSLWIRHGERAQRASPYGADDA